MKRRPPAERPVSLRDHLAALREADATLAAERDRRYSEVAAERERALELGNRKDQEALILARDIQHYRDEQSNNLRSQIEGERGNYATKEDLQAAEEKIEALIAPLIEFAAGMRQVSAAKRLDTAQLLQFLALIAVTAGVVFSILRK